VDRLTDGLERLPGPPWAYYVGTAAILALMVTASQWDGDGPFPPVRPFYFVFAALIPYVLAVIHGLDHAAAAALARFRPVLLADPASEAAMRRRLTTLPARPALAATLLGALGGLAFVFLVPPAEQQRLSQMRLTPLSRAVNTPLLIAMWAAFGILFYHTLHQLRAIGHILDHHTRVSLFEVSPMFGFSGVTAMTAVAISLVSVGWLLTQPATLTSAAGVIPNALFVGVAAATFVWPLLGAHRLLAREKDRLLGDNAEMIEAVRSALHGRGAASELTAMTDVHMAIASLEIERRLVDSTPTWPWSPATPRAVAAGLLLPLAIWALQRALERML
jgi:hypothetical protein